MTDLFLRWFALPQSTRWAIGIWIALLGGVFGRVIVDKPTTQSVIPIYLWGAERWAMGETLYERPPEGLDVFRNPPPTAALTVPFTWIHPKLAAILIRLIFITLYIVGLRQFLRDVAPPLSPACRAIYFSLAAILVIPSFNNGQYNLLMVDSALLGVSALARSRWWLAAFWMLVGVMVKVYPVALAGLAVVAEPRQLILRFVVVGAGLLALPFAMQHPEYVLGRYREFAEIMKEDDRTVGSFERAPRNWTILPRAYNDTIIPREISTTISFVAALILAGWTWRLRNGDRGIQLRFVFCSSLLWMMLFGPAPEMNTYSMLAPVASWLVISSPKKWVALCAWLGTLLLFAAIIRASFPSDVATGMTSLQPIGAMFLFVACFASSTSKRGDGVAPECLVIQGDAVAPL